MGVAIVIIANVVAALLSLLMVVRAPGQPLKASSMWGTVADKVLFVFVATSDEKQFPWELLSVLNSVGTQKVLLPHPGRGGKLSRAWYGGRRGWNGEKDGGGDVEEGEEGRILLNSRTCKLSTSMKQRTCPQKINS